MQEHPINAPLPSQKPVSVLPNLPPPTPPDPVPEAYVPPLFLKKSTIFLLILTGITLLLVLAYYIFS